MSEDDYDALVRGLKGFKDGLLGITIPSIDANESNYEAKMTILAKSKSEFNLINFSYSHDIDAINRIAQENDLAARLDIIKGIVRFRRKTED